MKKYSNMNDKQLVSLIKSGPPKAEPAFTEIYNRYSNQVFLYIFRILNDRAAAEDVYQETFLRFYEKVNISEFGSIKGFLITIARNLCLNHKRNKKNNVNIDDVQIRSNEFDYEKEELQKLIDMAVELLNPEDKEILVLRVYNGLNYKEISEICDLTVDNARIKVYRAKQKIKEILAPYIKDLSDLFENNKNNR